jgi:hypothetical protein
MTFLLVSKFTAKKLVSNMIFVIGYQLIKKLVIALVFDWFLVVKKKKKRLLKPKKLI